MEKLKEVIYMAGTRGIAQFRGGQLNSGIMRNRHFDEENKIDEKYIDIDFAKHKETLENTKIDVFSQINNKAVAGLDKLDISAELSGKSVADATTEGVVTGTRVDLRVAGSEDFPLIDNDGDRVYGRIEFIASPDGGVTPDSFVLNFFSEQDGLEAPYTFAGDAPNIDLRYVLRTNLSVIPVDAIVNGGAGFVEGATDANAYMNLVQLMKDIYGATGTLDNDGNSNLGKDIVTQIADEVKAREDGDKAIVDDLASNVDGKGANLVAVEVDAEGNYVGTTVQEVLTELASLIATFKQDTEDRVDKLENEDEEEVYEAVGGETSYNLVKGIAKPKSVLLSINGQVQAPGINFEYITNGDGNITGFNFDPDTLQVVNEIPDVLFVKYKKVL